MAIKGYSIFPKALALLKPHHQIVWCHIQDTCWGSLTPLQSVYSTGTADWAKQIYRIILWNCACVYIYIYIYIYYAHAHTMQPDKIMLLKASSHCYRFLSATTHSPVVILPYHPWTRNQLRVMLRIAQDGQMYIFIRQNCHGTPSLLKLTMPTIHSPSIEFKHKGFLPTVSILLKWSGWGIISH